MVTRRVRRIKRTGSKKMQSHHGRKTKRHHKRDNRTNKRHSGGMKSFAKMFTDKLNPRGDRHLYEGIEVFKGVAADGVARYYIGNRPIAEYEASPNLADRQYGKLIRTKLTGIEYNVDAGSTFNGITFMDKANFDKFEQKFPPPAPSSAASSASATSELTKKNSIQLELTKVKNKLNLYFMGKRYDLMRDQDLTIPVPSNPASRENPIRQLTFLATYDEANNKLDMTVKFVLKNNVISYCAMASYDGKNDHNPSLMGEFNYDIPSITKSLHLGEFQSSRETQIGVGDQIINLMDEIQKYANECNTDRELMPATKAYYEPGVRSAHIPDETRQRILELFEPSLASRMSAVVLGRQRS